MKQIRPPNGTHPMTGDPGYPDHVFEANGLMGFLDPPPPEQCPMAWDNVEKRYENGDKRLWFFDNGAYLLLDGGVRPPVVETGTWT